ncbi:uncharacterized protein LOC110160843 [Boleophthalmus pectinirostris]|uniref:uncharacterized protein LOC110160843 n=1 Tax=Boleophthalmus pectinirostris TaxID=150288 RepID=UPI00242B8E75|nr:uncharacterized protein LOC110160843 [Boleophthalmus pectinirostris]
MASSRSRTVVEEIDPNSWKSSKETDRGHTLGGHTLGGHTLNDHSPVFSTLDDWNELKNNLHSTRIQPTPSTRREPTWTRTEPTRTTTKPTRTTTNRQGPQQNRQGPEQSRQGPQQNRQGPQQNRQGPQPTKPTRTTTEPTRTTTETTQTRRESRERPGSSEPVRVEAGPGGVIPKTKAVSVRSVLLQTPVQYRENIHNVVFHQCPELRKFLNNRFPDDLFQNALKKVNFKKVQQTFSEVFRLRKLIHLGESVCVLYIGNICQGSGFVLFENLILTNAHLFCKALSEDGRTLNERVQAVFNYENPLVENDSLLIFDVHSEVIDLNKEMDYAILYLYNPEHKPVPPGLLPHSGPKPDDGGACVMGHPGGQVKKIDLTSIIVMNERQDAANEHLEPYDNIDRMVIVRRAREQNIESIWTLDSVITYTTTNMYHGSSGSPLFDDQCRLVGLHTSGFTYDFKGKTCSIIEYALPVLDIFSSFVHNMRTNGLLSREFVQILSLNPHLKEIFQRYGV